MLPVHAVRCVYIRVYEGCECSVFVTFADVEVLFVAAHFVTKAIKCTSVRERDV